MVFGQVYSTICQIKFESRKFDSFFLSASSELVEMLSTWKFGIRYFYICIHFALLLLLLLLCSTIFAQTDRTYDRNDRGHPCIILISQCNLTAIILQMKMQEFITQQFVCVCVCKRTTHTHMQMHMHTVMYAYTFGNIIKPQRRLIYIYITLHSEWNAADAAAFLVRRNRDKYSEIHACILRVVFRVHCAYVCWTM